MTKFLYLLVILSLVKISVQDTSDNEIEQENPFVEAAASMFSEENAPDLGSLLTNFMQSDSGKQMGEMLMSGGSAGAASKIIEGIGALAGQNNAGGGAMDLSMIGNVIGMLGNQGEEGKQGQGLDLSMIGNVLGMLNQGEKGKNAGIDLSMIGNLLSMVNTNQGGKSKNQQGGIDLNMIGSVLSMLGNQSPNEKTKGRSNEGFDLSSAMSLASSFMTQEGSSDMMSYLPTIMNLFSSFFGPEADKRASAHADHAWYLPPIVEKLHVMFDQFMNSDLGKTFVTKLGAEKFMKIFSDQNGNFSGRKFVELLENHSFRRHWIKVFTARLGEGLSYLANPYTQKKYISTGQFFLNNFLKGQGAPKSALFDPKRPTQSISAMINFFPMKYMNIKVDSTAAVKPVIEYVQDLIRLAENKGFLGRAIDSKELTHKLTDTINLEIIEPIARVNRAVRFAQKAPKCKNYVLCLANQAEPEEQLSVPGLKKTLSKGVTLVAAWYMGDNSNFMPLFNLVSTGQNCESMYHDECKGFHIEEMKVTTEYVHNEL